MGHPIQVTDLQGLTNHSRGRPSRWTEGKYDASMTLETGKLHPPNLWTRKLTKKPVGKSFQKQDVWFMNCMFLTLFDFMTMIWILFEIHLCAGMIPEMGMYGQPMSERSPSQQRWNIVWGMACWPSMDPHFTDRSPTMNLGETNRGAFFAGPTHRFWRLKCHEPSWTVHFDQQDGLLPLNLLCNLILYVYIYIYIQYVYMCIYNLLHEWNHQTGWTRVGPWPGGPCLCRQYQFPSTLRRLRGAHQSSCHAELRCGVSRGSMFGGFLSPKMWQKQRKWDVKWCECPENSFMPSRSVYPCVCVCWCIFHQMAGPISQIRWPHLDTEQNPLYDGQMPFKQCQFSQFNQIYCLMATVL